MSRPSQHRATRRRRGERGAVLVEMTIVFPVLMVISLAILDLGLGWRVNLTVSNGTRAGARVASNLGTSTSADKEALRAVGAALGSIPTAQVDMVVIFKADTAGGTVPTACTNATAKSNGGSSSSSCNTYTGAEVAAIASGAGPTFGTGCSTSRDRFWCPANRVNSQGAVGGPDQVGVYIKVNRVTSTKMFGSTMVIQDTAVMGIEPGAGS